MEISIALLLGLAGFVAVFLVWSLRQYRLLKLKERVERQLIRKEPRQFNLLSEVGFDKLLSGTQVLFDRAGIHYEKENTILILLLLSVFLLAGGLFLDLGLVAFLLPMAFIFLIYFLLLKMGENRLIKIEQELRFAMYDMSSSLRVKESLLNAIDEAAAKAKEPLKSELKQIVADVAGGEMENQALINFNLRTGSPIIAGWVDTIIFAKETGKELAATCERAALKIRDKNKMKTRVRSQTSGSKGTMVGILVILGVFFFTMVSMGTFEKVFFTKSGKTILAYVIISYLLSTLWVYRTIEREVNS